MKNGRLVRRVKFDAPDAAGSTYYVHIGVPHESVMMYPEEGEAEPEQEKT